MTFAAVGVVEGAVAGYAEAGTGERVASRVTISRMAHRLTLRLLLAALLLGACTSGSRFPSPLRSTSPSAGLLAARSSEEETATATRATEARSPESFPAIPHCGGELSTLAQVMAWADFQVLIPHDRLANDSNLDGLYICGASGLQIEYSSGVIIYESQNFIEDPEASWKRNASAYPNLESLTRVKGVLALATRSDPSVDPRVSPNGGLTLVIGDTYLVVGGTSGTPAADLERLVASLAPPDAGGTPSP